MLWYSAPPPKFHFAPGVGVILICHHFCSFWHGITILVVVVGDVPEVHPRDANPAPWVLLCLQQDRARTLEEGRCSTPGRPPAWPLLLVKKSASGSEPSLQLERSSPRVVWAPDPFW